MNAEQFEICILHFEFIPRAYLKERRQAYTLHRTRSVPGSGALPDARTILNSLIFVPIAQSTERARPKCQVAGEIAIREANLSLGASDSQDSGSQSGWGRHLLQGRTTLTANANSQLYSG